MIFLDFEFNQILEENVNHVCCTAFDDKTNETREFWLYRNSPNIKKNELKEYLEDNKEDTFFAWAVVAEARSFRSLGIDPYHYKWIDGFLEFRALTNHNDDLNWGEQLVKGKVVRTHKPRPKWERVEGEKQKGFRHTHSLAEATFKLLGQIRDTEHKDLMRKIIISDNAEEINLFRDEIQAYCTEDVVFLPALYQAILDCFEQYTPDEYFDKEELYNEMLVRGKYAALTAIRESKGYPINVEKTRNFSDQVAAILDTAHRDINSQFPETPPFRFNKSKGNFSWNQIQTKKWISKNFAEGDWLKTKKGALSLSLEAWSKQFSFTHSYPRGNFGAQMVRYLKLKQSLNGFSPTGKKSFWDSFCPTDQKVRPYMNIYGAQSSRSQPGSTSYLLLKPAWQRSLLQAPKGKWITSVDYGSEEYLLSAIYFGDEKMVDSYASGDVYLAFAIASGMAPEGATKVSHKAERNLAKATVLGISYLMSKYGLAKKLTDDTGEEYTEDEAQEFIDSFYETYSDFAEGQQDFIEQYKEEGYAKLPGGWPIFGSNDNFRSVGNVPIQGFGGDVMREADFNCYEAGLEVPCTLHDALYIVHDEGDMAAVDTLIECMRKGFLHHVPEEQKHQAEHIRLDAFTWGEGIPAPTFDDEGNKIYHKLTTPKGLEVDASDFYIDERAEDEYKIFSKYFEKEEEFEL
jgi:hypothetical protein